jgi:hypothetical protein
MIMAFLSSRIRTWVLFAVLLPLAGRVLEAVGLRTRNPRVSNALTKAGGYARQSPRSARGVMSRRR